MKRHATLVLARLAGIALFFSPGCEKAFDYIKNHPGENAQLCQIQKLIIGPPGRTNEITFTYDANGNPLSQTITRHDYTATTSEYHFRYDKYGRLTDNFFNYFGGTGVLVWHEYSYHDKRTVIDTEYAYTGSINDPVHPHDAASFNLVIVYSLDASGRIIKTTQYYNYPGLPPTITNFAYDAHGNLIRPGASYDNKVNVYQTNKVWMFIYNDYSVNNLLNGSLYTTPTVITSYNPLGLPLTMSNPQGYLFNYLFSNLQIVYNCDPSKEPKW